jgi:uncharacterized protein YndB with AHSA1/START domain
MASAPLIAPPDLSSRPLKSVNEISLSSSPAVAFQAWSEHLDQWLAAPGTALLTAQPNTAFYFETHHGSGRQPYYGRVLRSIPNRLLELVWLSPGTQGLETILTLEFIPNGTGTTLHVTHAGFAEETYRAAHEQVWPTLIQAIDEVFANS